MKKNVAAIKTVKPNTATKKAPVKVEKNTDALEKPHAVAGKPHHYQYK